jgi:hypothetical protein
MVYSGDVPPYNWSIPEAFSRPGGDFWAAGGAGVAEIGLSSSPLVNPAAMNFSNFGIYVEGIQRFDASWTDGYQFDGQTDPSLAMVSFNWEDHAVAIGFANTYDLHMTKTVETTTSEYPDGDGQSITLDTRVLTDLAFVSIGQPLTQDLSVGATGGLNYIHADVSLFQAEGTGGYLGEFVSVGALLEISKNMQLGTDVQYESNPPFSISSNTPGFFFNTISVEPPWVWNVGLSWKVAPALTLLGSAEYQHWSSVEDYYNNVAQFHAGVVLTPSNSLTVRFGFFSQNAPQQGDQGFLDENFITAGLHLKLSSFIAVSITGMDSRPLSNSTAMASPYYLNPDLRQSSVTVGMSYGPKE